MDKSNTIRPEDAQDFPACNALSAFFSHILTLSLALWTFKYLLYKHNRAREDQRYQRLLNKQNKKWRYVNTESKVLS
jgi:hypothetical protein